jgi:hypothetical protein
VALLVPSIRAGLIIPEGAGAETAGEDGGHDGLLSVVRGGDQCAAERR